MEHVGNYRMFDDASEPEPSDELANFPAVPLPLIDELEQRFPDRLPSSYTDDFSLGRLIGQQDIIRLLRQVAGRRT